MAARRKTPRYSLIGRVSISRRHPERIGCYLVVDSEDNFRPVGWYPEREDAEAVVEGTLDVRAGGRAILPEVSLQRAG